MKARNRKKKKKETLPHSDDPPPMRNLADLFDGNPKPSARNPLNRGVHYIRNLGTHHRIATAIQEIKIQVHNISQRKDMYTIKFIDNGTSNAATDRLHDRHMAALFIEEAELVGIEKPKEELIGWLVKGESQLKVISVVGMGGLGKTTLVRKVYDHERVKGWLSCHVWITVTQLFTVDELLSVATRISSDTSCLRSRTRICSDTVVRTVWPGPPTHQDLLPTQMNESMRVDPTKKKEKK